MTAGSGVWRVELVQGDITRESTEAIVNAANSSLLGGGGVDGAIHRTGGPQIIEECQAIRRRCGELPAGQAAITSGGRLAAKWVIHTVGPIWRGGRQREPELLQSCYRESLRLAQAHGLRSIAFPSISTGAYGYPADQAAGLALAAVFQLLERERGSLERVRFVLFDAQTLEHYQRALAALEEDRARV